MVNWGAVVFGLIIIGAIFYLPIASIGMYGTVSIPQVLPICDNPYSKLFFSGGSCDMYRMAYYGGLLLGVIALGYGFLAPKPE